MKKETFDKAQKIQNQIQAINNAIDTIDLKESCSPPSVRVHINDILYGDNQIESFDHLEKKVKATALRIFKAERLKLQKEFDNLK